MSVASQLSTIAKRGNRSAIFNTINNYVDIKVKTNAQKGSQDKIQRLEQFFQVLKNAITNKEKKEEPEFEDFINIIRNNLGDSNFNALFNYTGMQNWESGNRFEEHIVAIINAAANNTNFASVLGQEKGTSDLLFTASDLSKKYENWLDVFSEAIDNGIKKYVIDKAQRGNSGLRGGENDLYRLGEVQGKIDIKVPQSNLTFLYGINPKVQEFLSLLSGHNITAKNYMDINKVSFGHTAPFRIYATVLPQMGYGVPEVLQAYNIQRCIRKQHHNYMLVHYVDEKLRIYYEITGDGISYEGTKLGPADLIIINERAGANIHVYDSYRFLQEKFEQIKKKWNITISS